MTRARVSIAAAVSPLFVLAAVRIVVTYFGLPHSYPNKLAIVLLGIALDALGPFSCLLLDSHAVVWIFVTAVCLWATWFFVIARTKIGEIHPAWHALASVGWIGVGAILMAQRISAD